MASVATGSGIYAATQPSFSPNVAEEAGRVETRNDGQGKNVAVDTRKSGLKAFTRGAGISDSPLQAQAAALADPKVADISRVRRSAETAPIDKAAPKADNKPPVAEQAVKRPGWRDWVRFGIGAGTALIGAAALVTVSIVGGPILSAVATAGMVAVSVGGLVSNRLARH